jgi:hypothetical protein
MYTSFEEAVRPGEAAVELKRLESKQVGAGGEHFAHQYIEIMRGRRSHINSECKVCIGPRSSDHRDSGEDD